MAWTAGEFRARYRDLARYYDTVVARAARRLRAGARISNFELRWPQRWPGGLAAFAAWRNRPTGVTPNNGGSNAP